MMAKVANRKMQNAVGVETSQCWKCILTQTFPQQLTNGNEPAAKF